MVATVGSIAVAFSADLRRYEASLKRGEKVTNDATGRMGRGVMQLERRFAGLGAGLGKSAFGGLAAGATAALAPILSLAGALAGAKSAMAEFSKMADVSARLGVPVERLQELRFAAEQSGMAIDNFDVAFRRFIRRSSEAAKGTGAAKDAFKELGIQLRDNDGRLKQSDKLLGEVADALQKVQNPADKLRLAFKLFDTDGAAMVNVLAKGSAGLDEFAQKARQLGIVVDEHLINRAAELQTEFETATRILDLQFKQALVNLAPIIVGIAERAARLASDIRGLIDSMRGLENQGAQSLDGRMRKLGLERLDVEKQIADIREMQRNMVPDASGGYTWERELGEWNNRLKQIADEESRIIEILKGRETAPVAPLPEGSPIDYDTGGGSGRASTRNAAAEAALREAEAVRDLIANLEHERAMIGLTDAEKRKLTELRRVGGAATAEEKTQIEQLIDAIDRETKALADNQRQQEQRMQAIESLFQMGGDALMSIVDGSMKAEDALKRLIVQLAQAALQAALLGSGPLAGLFGGGGGLFGSLGGLVGEGRTFPGHSCGAAERINHFAGDVIPNMQDLGLGVVAGYGGDLDVPADFVHRLFPLDKGVHVLPLPHGVDQRDSIRPEPIAA